MKFKKIAAIIGSCVLVGATLGVVTPAYTTPFIENGVGDTAIVYGTGSAPSDLTGANQISNYLSTFALGNETITNSINVTNVVENVTSDFSSSVGITDDEVELGVSIVVGGSKLRAEMLDTKISSLLDEKLSWDDGTHDIDYNIHEVIELGNKLETKTTLDNNDLDETALFNDRALSYKYIFEKDLFAGTKLDLTSNTYDDAEDLKIDILGKEYSVEEFDSNSMVISSSKERIVKLGDIFVVEGVTLKVDEVFENAIQVSGVVIKEGESKKVNGISIEVDSIAYHSSAGLFSKALINVGKDISTTYEDGDDYIGEDEANPEWVWTINNPGKKDGWIGVTYDLRQLDEEDDLVYEDEAYVFPENYAAVQFNGLTNVDYDDFELYFEDTRLYNSTLYKIGENEDVVILEGNYYDSFTIGNSIESSKIAIHYNAITTDYSLFYADEDENDKFILADHTLPINLVAEDSVLPINLNVANDLEVGDMTFDLYETLYLGAQQEEAESSDIEVNGKSVGKYENDVLTHKGVLIETPESNLDDDRVIFSVPTDDVFASISVFGQGEVITSTSTEEVNSTETVFSTGAMVVLDTEIDSVKDKNLIIVGGSCINKAAAKVLGIPEKTCGVDFTAATGVGAGSYLLKAYTSPYNTEKVVTLIAGYEAADTTAAINTFLTVV